MKLTKYMAASFALVLMMICGVNAKAQTLSADALSIAPGEEKETAFNFTNDAEKQWHGFSIYVNIRERLNYVAANEDGEWAIFGDQNAKHLTSAEIRKSDAQAMSVSMAHKTKALVDGVLFTIKVKADETLAANATIKLTDIVFASSTGDIDVADVTVDVTRAEATAINEVNTEAATAEIFNVAGVQQKTLKNGQVNILRDVNGKITKVFKK